MGIHILFDMRESNLSVPLGIICHLDRRSAKILFFPGICENWILLRAAISQILRAQVAKTWSLAFPVARTWTTAILSEYM